MNIKKLFLTTALFLGIFIFTGEIKTQAQSSCTGGCTYMLTQGSDGQALFSTVQTNKYDYTPGEEVRANLCITNNSSKINLGTTAGGTNGMWKVLLNGGNCVYDRVGYAPSSAGTYAANFETNFTRTNPACSDGIDNDGDGYTDYPNDPGCWGAQDDDEYNAPTQNSQYIPFGLTISSASCGTGDVSPCLQARIDLSQPLSQAVTIQVAHDYFDTGVNGPDTAHFGGITIPAGQTTADKIVQISGSTAGAYLNPDQAQYTYVTVGGTQSHLGNIPTQWMNAFGNVYLGVNNYSAGYHFECRSDSGPWNQYQVSC